MEAVHITLGIILVLEFLVGVACNITVLMLPPPKWAKSMKSGNLLIKNLHSIDLIICLFLIPLTFTVLIYSPNTPVTLCFFHESLVSFANCGGCLNVFFISLERYNSVVSSSSNSTRNAKIYICIVWIVSTIGFVLPWINLAIRTASMSDILSAEENVSFIDCEHLIMSYNNYTLYETFGIGIFFLTCIAIVVCYAGIFKVAKRRLLIQDPNKDLTVRQSRNALKKKQEKRALNITLAIVGTFMLCWCLFIIASIAIMVVDPTTNMNLIHLLSLCMVYLSSISHPILYRFVHDDIKCFCKKTRGVSLITTEISMTVSNPRQNSVSPNVGKKLNGESTYDTIAVPANSSKKVDIFTTQTSSSV